MNIKRSVCILLSLLLVCSSQVLAAEQFVISITLGEVAANQRCTLLILNQQSENITMDQVKYIAETAADNAGNLSYSFAFSGSSGVYPYVVRSESGEQKNGNFTYINPTEETERAKSDAYYLLDEDFNMIKANTADPMEVSGWDLTEKGGYLDYEAYSSFTLNDTETIGRLKFERQFETTANTQLTLEFRFSQANLQDDTAFAICKENIPVAAVYTMGGGLYAGNSETRNYLQSYSANTEYGIRMELNLKNKTYNVYVNGSLCRENIAFCAKAEWVDKLVVTTGIAATGKTEFRPVRIHRGYLVEDKFISNTVGPLLSGYWKRYNAGGSIQLERQANTAPPDTYHVALNDTSPTEQVKIYKPLALQTCDLAWEFKVNFPNGITEAYASLGDGATISFLQNQLFLENTKICDLRTNFWYTVRMETVAMTGGRKLFINGKEKSVPPKNGSIVVNELSFYTSASTMGKMLIDDISLKEKLPLPVDYVSEPKVVKKDSIIGIQTCDLWREGKHFGWDKVGRDDLRIPYLGCYDDGSTEVADWEIKYMAEHGIDFTFRCWYRPPGGMGAPIKEPRNGASLHKGYFGAKYKDKVKFAITWENGSGASTNSEDFRQNIVPFWVEYYLKDSGYMVIDQKPVIGIYNMNALKASFGSIAAVADEIAYLKQVCKDLGFAGAYVLGVSGSTDSGTLAEFRDAGMDGIYCYSWGNSSKNPDYQKNKLQAQKDKNIISVVPTIAMGRDDTTWNRGSGGFMSPNDFQKLASWTKQEFMPTFGATELGRKMVLIDNWNEYGEGHFFMPTKLGGFGYLEALSMAFGGVAHDDEIPVATQKKRMGRLYPANRMLQALEYPKNTPLIPIAKKGWYFTDSVEGFSKNWQINKFGWENGAIWGVSIGSDPIVYTPKELNIPIDNVNYIKIRIKVNAAGKNGRIYFVTDQKPTYDEVKGFDFTIENAVNDYKTISIPTGHSSWKGTLKQLRIDPMDAAGTFFIDSIELMTRPDSVGRNQIPYGGAQGNTLPNARGVACSISNWDFKEQNQSFSCVTDGNGEIAFPIALQAGKQYVVNAWIRAQIPRANYVLKVRYLKDGNVYEEIISENPVLYKEEWSQSNSLFTAQSSGPGELLVTMQQAGTYYVDDVCLYPLGQNELIVKDSAFYTENGRLINKLADAGERVKCTAEVYNGTNEVQTVFMYLASYQNGRLKNMRRLPQRTLQPGSIETFTAKIDSQQCDEIKQFVWQNDYCPIDIVTRIY